MGLKKNMKQKQSLKIDFRKLKMAIRYANFKGLICQVGPKSDQRTKTSQIDETEKPQLLEL